MSHTTDVEMPRTSSSLGRALAVVDYLAARSPDQVGVSTVARELNLSKTVAHRILKELVANGFISFDETSKQYRLGHGALSVGLAALRGIDVLQIAARHMRRLVSVTEETATISIRQGWVRVYLDQVLSPHEVRMTVSLGSRHPLFAGSSSKAILAALPDAEVAEYLASHQIAALTKGTIRTQRALLADIEAIRRRGYAESRGERQAGAGSVAAAIRLGSGQVFGSLSICGPLDRFPDVRVREYGQLVKDAAAQITAELGYLGHDEH